MTDLQPQRRGSYLPLSLATTIATYLLIAVGALVRAAGAGLGCPDWPRCFGDWVPPTRAADLPPGFDISQFNVFNTWLEYVNRLLGVTIGLLIFATLVSAWRRHRDSRHITWPTTAAFVLVGFEGWLGGQVVKQELADDVLTAHLVVALVIVGLLLYAHLCARHGSSAIPAAPGRRRLGMLGWLVGVLVLVQAGLGTRVRALLKELVDLPRAEWLPLGWWPDLAHRQLGALAFLACVALVWASRRLRPRHPGAQKWALCAAGLGAVQLISGLVLAYGGVPPAMQVVHLALASLLVGALSVFLFEIYRVAPAG
jgi:cytochrome c oxidase assembly protein subunit 15